MRVSYQATWREHDREPRTVRLSVGSASIVLSPVGEEQSGAHELPLDEIVAVEVRPAGEGKPSATLILKSGLGDVIELETPVERWIVADILERLFARELGARGTERLLVSVRLKPGMQAAARELLAVGPPFDPQGTALRLHEVFLLEDEALFLFETDAALAIESLVEPDLWGAVGAWRDLMVGDARLAESVYSWRRGEGADGLHIGLGY